MSGTFLGIDIDAMDLQRAKIWSTDGTFTWTCPAGVTGIFFSGCGFGGDGGKNGPTTLNTSYQSTFGASGAGGGSAAYAERVCVPVIAGETYTITISKITGVTAFGLVLGNGGKGADAVNGAWSLGGVPGVGIGIGSISGKRGGRGGPGGFFNTVNSNPVSGGGAGLGTRGADGVPIAIAPTAYAYGKEVGSGAGGGGVGSPGQQIIEPAASSTVKGTCRTGLACLPGDSAIPMFRGLGGDTPNVYDAYSAVDFIDFIQDGLNGAGAGGGQSSHPSILKGGSAEFGSGGGGACASKQANNTILNGGTGGKALAIIEY